MTPHNLRLELLRALGSGSPSTDCLMAVSEQARREAVIRAVPVGDRKVIRVEVATECIHRV